MVNFFVRRPILASVIAITMVLEEDDNIVAGNLEKIDPDASVRVALPAKTGA